MLLCAGCVAFTSPAIAAAATTPSLEDLQAQIVTLQNQIAQLLAKFSGRLNGNGNGIGQGSGIGTKDLAEGIHGTVTAVNEDDGELTVNAIKPGTSTKIKYTVATDDDTEIIQVANNDGKISEKDIAIGDIKVNDTVWVSGTITDSTIAAAKIRVGEMGWNTAAAKIRGVRGTVTEAGSDNIKIDVKNQGSHDDTTYTVTANDNTTISQVSKGGGTVAKDENKSLSDIQKGDTVMVRGTIDGDTIAATKIRFGDIKGGKNGWDREISGKVTVDNGSKITLSVTKAGSSKATTYTVTAADDITVKEVAKGTDGKPTEKTATFDDIAKDDTIWVTGTINEDNDTIEATEIRIGEMGWMRNGGPGNGAGRGQGKAVGNTRK